MRTSRSRRASQGCSEPDVSGTRPVRAGSFEYQTSPFLVTELQAPSAQLRPQHSVLCPQEAIASSCSRRIQPHRAATNHSNGDTAGSYVTLDPICDSTGTRDWDSRDGRAQGHVEAAVDPYCRT